MRFFARKNKGKSILLALGLAAASFPALPAKADVVSEALESATVLKNIFVDGRDVGNMNGEELESTLETISSEGQKTVVSLRTDFGDVEIKLSDVGYRDNTRDLYQEILAVGNSGNVLSRYREQRAVEQGPLEFDVERSISTSAFETAIRSALGDALNISGEYRLVKHDDGSVNVLYEGGNQSINFESTADEIRELLKNGESGRLSLSAVTGGQDDSRSQAIAEIHDLLGTFTTNYNGPSGRMQNIERATELMNGKVLFPGDQISVYQNITPIETYNGYAVGHMFVNNKIVDGVGGGVCQVSTTLYNASLLAELEIIQRNNHSLRVSYVPIAMDAAIAGGILDLKLRNNLDAPIYIEGITEGGYLTFNIYGKEYRPSNRTIKYESYQTATVNPPEDVVTEDPTLEPGEERITEKASYGSVGELWKYIYIDGELTDSIMINRSSYSATPNYVSRNSEEPSEEESEEETTEEPSEEPTEVPTEVPTEAPTEKPTEKPTEAPTETPTEKPTEKPTEAPGETPTEEPSQSEENAGAE